MKQLKLLATAFAVCGMFLFLSSCNQGNEKKSDDAIVKNDSTPAKPQDILFIKHQVANFEQWLAVYDSHDSVRLAYGLHNYGLSRGIDDPNMVLVALKIDDMNKAKAFVALPNLLDAIKPTIMYYNRQMFDVSTTKDLTRVMVSHRVKDFDAWKKEFESHKQVRTDAGLKDRSFGFEAGDNKMVYVIDTYSDLQKAKDFFASKELQDKMQAAGVEGAPVVFFYKLVKKY